MKVTTVTVLGVLSSMVLAACATSPDPERSSANRAAASASSFSGSTGTPDESDGKDSAGTTAGRKAGKVVVVAIGDISCTPGSETTETTCRQADTADLAEGLNPDAVLALGDLQYEKGRLKHFRRSYDKSWGALKSITHPVPGNHEYYTSGAKGYYTYFDNRQPGAPGYYTRTLGDWTAYALNSNCDRINCDKQVTWLKKQLKNDTGCSLFYDHHPRYSSGEHGSQGNMKRFFRIAYKNDVELFLSGHDHHYERYAPKNAVNDVRKKRGVVQYVSGAGGKTHYQADGNVKGSRTVIDDVYGVLRLALRSDGYNASFRGIDGSTRDAVSRSCR